jgi:SAM-dependent methyltransferase
MTDRARHEADPLVAINRAIRADPVAPLCRYFAEWPIEDFGALFLTDLSAYPDLRHRLPRMPPGETQRSFGFYDGAEMMERSVRFMRFLKTHYERTTASDLADARVLDYGAGWGRMARMMLQFIPDERVHACDAAPRAVELFNSLGFQRAADLIATVPASLPYESGQFDLVWLFSVFTHLPEYAADAAMRALLPVLKPTGLLVVTVHPAEFWETNPIVAPAVSVPEMLRRHRETGFAHAPSADGGVWGDTSMTPEYMARRWPEWKVMGAEEEEGHQVAVLLQPA